MDYWKKVSLYVAIPSMFLVAFKALSAPHPARDEFKPYPWLRTRRKVFEGYNVVDVFHY
jgi:hypothetical protein